MSENKFDKLLKHSGVDPITRIKTVLLALGVYDFSEKIVLERELGNNKAKELRSKIWSKFFEINTERYKRQLKGRKMDIPTLGLMMKKLQEENFSAMYEIEENTPEQHIGYIRKCPLWADEDSLMKEALGDRLQKDLLTLDNVYDISQIEVGAMVQASGLGDTVSAKMSNLVCLGGDPKLGCRIVIKRKESATEDPILPLPRHCEEPMQIVGGKVKCLICGKTQPYHEYDRHVPRQEQPRHCEQPMSILKVLECRVCKTRVDFQL